MEETCYFSTDITGTISCSKYPDFDDLGFPVHDCIESTWCEKIKRIRKEVPSANPPHPR